MEDMTFKDFLHAIGLGDGEGNTSVGRVIAFISTLGAFVPQVKAAILSSGADLGNPNLKLIALAIASHQLTKWQEKYQVISTIKNAVTTLKPFAQDAVKTGLVAADDVDAAQKQIDLLLKQLTDLGVKIEVNQPQAQS